MLHISLFSAALDNLPLVVSRSFLILINSLVVFYTTWFYTVPKLYIKKKYILFTLSVLITLLYGSIAKYFVERFFGFPFLPELIEEISSHEIGRNLFFGFIYSLVLIFLSFFLKIYEVYLRKAKHEDQLIHQKTEAELKLLKAQLNPHFLFNALNNIYALVLTKSEKAPDALMSLSQLLRYIVYDAVVSKVQLAKEIKYLEYYIELERLRLTDETKVDVNINLDDYNYQILPLIFIPFVENAFKHGNLNKGGELKIDITSEKNRLQFSCKNTFIKKEANGTASGVGLSNTQKRLALLYPNKHKLITKEDNNIFTVDLTIQL
jgi:two-component system LytT family sensor kinase